MKFRFGALVVTPAVIGCGVLVSTQEARQTFEVASVRRNTSGTTQTNAQVRLDRLSEN